MGEAQSSNALQKIGGLAAFVEDGTIALIATRNAAMQPHVTRALAPRLKGGGAGMSLCVPVRESAQCLADLQESPRIAITIADPRTYRTYQFKGIVTVRRDLGEAERQSLARYLPAVLAACAQVGMPPQFTDRLWSRELTCLEVTLNRGFTQTPGDTAGKSL